MKNALDDEEFHEIFNNAVTDYKDNWAEFEEKIIKPTLNKILDIVNDIKNDIEASNLDHLKKALETSRFDFFSTSLVAICNRSMASALYTLFVYAKINKNWIDNDKSNKLKKWFELLTKTRVPRKGWQYYLIEKKDKKDDYVNTLSTWLSLVTLYYIPEDIITENLRKEIEDIKKETILWLKGNVQEYSWYFLPDDMEDREFSGNTNAISTAQAILALFYCGVDPNDEQIKIKCSLDFIKNEISSEKSSEDKPNKLVYKGSIPISKSDQEYPALQCCLQALLIYSYEDEAISYSLNEVIKLIDSLINDPYIKTYRIEGYLHAALLPLLWYLNPSAKPPVLKEVKPPISLQLSDFSDSKRQFESFVSGAESIWLIGEIDSFYAKLIPKDGQVTVTVLYRDTQDAGIFENQRWKYYELGKDKTYELENINCLIVNGTKVLLSSTSFKKWNRYSFYKCLEDDEAAVLIKQIEEITNKEITVGTNVINQIHKIEGVKDFSKHWNTYMEHELMTVDADVQKGILEYFKFTPGYTEIKGSALGLSDNRKDVEKELSKRGIFSRIFINHDLKDLLERSVSKEFTPYLVLDESSTYLLLNTDEGTEEEKKVIICCSACLGQAELHVVSEIYDKLKNKLKKFLGEEIDQARFDRIIPIKKEDDLKKYFDESIQYNKKYQLTTNEKIAISQVAQGSDFGIITNSWEVTKVCKENKNKDKEEIKTFSVMKFLEEEKNEEMYKIFRIPIDEFR